MSLLSIKFFLFLTGSLVLYYLIPKRFRWAVLLLESIGFYYICSGAATLTFMVVTVISTYCAARKIQKIADAAAQEIKDRGSELSRTEKRDIKDQAQKQKKRVFLAGILLNFGILAVLKYTNFVTGNINHLLGAAHTGLSIPTVSFLLPLGISFYTFQVMGYLIDVYHGKCTAENNIFRFALFTSYFPQIIQGPISKYDALAPQLYEGHSFDAERFHRGIMRFMWGAFKKMVIADRAAIFVNEVLANYTTNNYTGFTVFIGVLFFGFQMYGDFSGGIDMIMGVSDLFGISLLENFRQPYFAKTVSEFWQRWHISLGHWMKNYIFYPIALSKSFSKLSKKTRQKYGAYYGKILPAVLASFVVFLVVGVWHGAAWKFIAFGVYHAILTSADSVFERPSASARNLLHIDAERFDWRLFQILRTIGLITIGRYFDCAYSFRMAAGMLKATFTSFNPNVFFDGSLLKLGLDGNGMRILLLAFIFLMIVDYINEKGVVLRELFAKQGFVFRGILYIVVILFLLRFGIYGTGYDAAAFIYQGF
ncbi:MAG: MBOAT family protein [Eubacterium sp.]|nr:MBOAT family protein [Eubacterium sp.]